MENKNLRDQLENQNALRKKLKKASNKKGLLKDLDVLAKENRSLT